MGGPETELGQSKYLGTEAVHTRREAFFSTALGKDQVHRSYNGDSKEKRE